MSKPLELTVYDRNDDGDYLETPAGDGKRYVIAQEDVEVYCMDKRFTDAELAAEHFGQVAVSAQMDVHGLLAGDGPAANAFNEQADLALGQAEVLERFATLPHYDEDQP